MANESQALIEGFILLGILLLLLILIPSLIIYAVLLMVTRIRKHKPMGGTALRLLTIMSTCSAAFFYFVGCTCMVQDESGADAMCKATVPPELAGESLSYHLSFIPLRSTCRVEGAGSFDIRGVSGNFGRGVPRYVNPSVAVATGVAVAALVAVRRFPDEDPCQIEPEELEPEGSKE